MPIDKTGEYWIGTEAADLEAYLKAFQAGGYPVVRAAYSRCRRDGSAIFTVRVDDEEGYAERRCVSCGDTVLMLDSEGYADDATPEVAACPCGGEEFEVAVGYALYSDGGVRWVSIGLRCVRD